MKSMRRVMSLMLALVMLAGLISAFADEKGSFRFDSFSGGAMGMEFIDVVLDEDADTVSLWPSDTIRSVVLEVLDTAEDGKLIAHIIWTADMMESNQVINLQAYMGETMPRFRIHCINVNGQQECYYLEESGRDGSLLLTDAASVEETYSVEYEGLDETLDEVLSLSDRIAAGDEDAVSALVELWEKQRLALWGGYAQSETEKKWVLLRQVQTEPLVIAGMNRDHVYELMGEGAVTANSAETSAIIRATPSPTVTADSAEASAPEGTLPELLDAAVTLFFETDNVTVSGTADFSLDDVLFKQASVTHIQCGNRAFREMVLQTPLKNGSIRENSYTVWVDGNSTHAAESRTNGTVQDYSPLSDPRSSILEYSLPLSALIPVLRMAMAQAEDSFEIRMTDTENGGKQISLQMSGDSSAALNAVLNLGMQFLFGKLYGIRFEHSTAKIHADYSGIEDYGTVSDGIRYSTRSVMLDDCSFRTELDEQSRPLHIEGKVSLILNMVNGDSHSLGVSFDADAGSYGSSTANRGQAE